MSRTVVVSEVVVFPYVIRSDGKIRYVDWYYGYEGHDRDKANLKITPAEVIGSLADELCRLRDALAAVDQRLGAIEFSQVKEGAA